MAKNALNNNIYPFIAIVGSAVNRRGEMLMRKQLFSTLLAASMLLSMFTVGFAAEEETTEEETVALEEGEQLAAILEAGYITIGTEGTYPPYSFHDEDGELTGFEVEIGRAIAKQLGVEARFVEADWDSLLAGLEAERFDIIINDVTPTDERRETYDFSDPYTLVHYVIITREDNDKIASFEDLDGMTTSNTISSTHALIAEEYGAEVIAVDNFEQSVEMVVSGRADATINSELVFEDYMSRQPEAGLKIAAVYPEGDVTAIPVRKGEGALLNALNEALAALIEDGTLADISEKYFDRNITPESEDTEIETEEASSEEDTAE